LHLVSAFAVEHGLVLAQRDPPVRAVLR
jgi:hypothetical protein